MEIECARKYLDKLINSYAEIMEGNSDGNEMGESTKLMLEHQLKDNPLRVMVSFSDGAITHRDIEEIINNINRELNKN